MDLTRREALGTATAAGVLLAAGGVGVADEKEAVRGVAPGKHAIVPLPFDPKKLDGLSERLLVSHHENNYGGALRNLNKVEEEIARLGKDAPPFVVGALRERELTFTNSVILHELYFANLGGGGKAAGAIATALAQAFGAAGRWEELLRAAALSLAGGSGWALMSYNFHSDDLRFSWSGNHSQALALAHPLLVLDMYEHAFHIDYGAAAAKYVDAFFRNVRWEEVERRYHRALRASKALRG
jgi:Fe-Mn family superoxide dismutase